MSPADRTPTGRTRSTRPSGGFDTRHASSSASPALADSLLASAQCVQGVLMGQSLSDCLDQIDARLRPSAQAISFHVMRRLGLARAIRRQLVKRTPSDRLLDALLMVSLALLETAILAEADPDDTVVRRRGTPVYAVHTVVDQSVSAARPKHWRGLINATLRNYIRQRDTVLARALTQDDARWNYPDWWVQEIRRAWPEQWQAVLQAGDTPGPMTLRVNRRRASRDDVLQRFQNAGIAAEPLADYAIVLAQPQPVHALPGFSDGLWSVQDFSAQRAGELLPLQAGMRVLDACAAPGGKTAHLLERADITLQALDADAVRLKRVQDTLGRLGLQGDHVRLQHADASDLNAWWDGEPFDAILADVPCTASGVVRRHPDIRWLRRPDDVARTATLQRTIIDALWQTLAPGGHLLFVTCSVFPAEGELQASRFCQRHADARRLPAPGQVLPLEQADGQDGGDGFFYALFCKATQS